MFTSIGKKVSITTTMAFDSHPKPNQKMTIGAKAMIGIELLTTA